MPKFARKPEPFLLRGDEAKERATRKRPRAHEAELAKALGGMTTKASGATEHDKGDVKGVEAGNLEFLVECKTTQDKSLRVEVGWLVKITAEACPDRMPALAIRFSQRVIEEAMHAYYERTRSPAPFTDQDWVAVPLSVFKRMAGALDIDIEEVP